MHCQVGTYGLPHRFYLPIAQSQPSKNTISSEAFLAHGIKARKNKSYKLALQSFSSAYTISQNPQMLFESAVTHLWAGQLKSSLSSIEAFLKAKPNHTEARIIKARLLGWLHRSAEAEIIFNQILKEAPQHKGALNGFAQWHVAQMKLGLAKKIYNNVLTLDEDNSEALKGLETLNNIKTWRMRGDLMLVFNQEEVSQTAFNLGLQKKFTPKTTMGLHFENLSNRPESGGFARGAQLLQFWHNRKINKTFNINSSIGWRSTSSNHHLTFDGLMSTTIYKKTHVLFGLGSDIALSRDQKQLRTQVNLLKSFNQSWCMTGIYANRDALGNNIVGSTMCEFAPFKQFKLGISGAIGQTQKELSLQTSGRITSKVTKSLNVSLHYQHISRPFSQKRAGFGCEISW